MTTSQEEGLLSASDDEQLSYIRDEGRVIFTEDADFLRLHASGEPHPGIAYCAQQTRSIGQIIHGLLLIWELLEPGEMENVVEYL